MRSPEFLEHQEGLSEAERRAERALEAQKLLDLYEFAKGREAESGRILEGDFENAYGAPAVQHDQGYVEGRKRDAAKRLAALGARERYEAEESRRLAYVMEVMLQEEGELSEWFGPNARTVMASEYDDWKNGVDAIVEFETEDGAEHLALAIDFTLSHGSLEKIQRIKEDIDAGQAARVKYFYSERTGQTTSLENVAKVVVTCDTATLLDAAGSWKKAAGARTRAEGQRELKGHPIQMILLREIQQQLEVYRSYADGAGKKKFAALYAGNLAIVDAILTEKKGRIPARVSEDGGYRNLLRALEITFRK